LRLLLLSNSKNPGQGYLQHAEDLIKSFLDTAVGEVLFVPYAAVRVSHDEFAATVGRRFADLGYTLDSVHTRRDPAAAVADAEAVVVGGGNTWHLLRALHQAGLVEAIRKRVRAGMPYLGWSAGANVAGPTIKTTNDMPIVEPPTFEALALVPFQLNPHYTEDRIPNHAGETRAERLLEFVAANPGVPVVGLREGSALRVEGSTLQLVGPHPAKVYVSGVEPTEYPPGSSLQFLMR
jgi:dipeptidase E